MNTTERDDTSIADVSPHLGDAVLAQPQGPRTQELAISDRFRGKAKRTKSLNELIMCKPLSIEFPVPKSHSSVIASTAEEGTCNCSSLYPSISVLCNICIKLSVIFVSETPNRKRKAVDRSQQPSCELAVISVHEYPFVRPVHDIGDISKGEEKVKIPIVNEFPGERCPPHFTYIPNSTIYQNAYLNFSLARIGDDDCCADCFGDCLSASLPCACTRETGGEFAYTPGGLLKNDFLDECMVMHYNPPENRMVYCKDCPLERAKDDLYPDECKGHLVRRFIKECWIKCGCHKLCGNRVVQQGIWCNLQVLLCIFIHEQFTDREREYEI